MIKDLRGKVIKIVDDYTIVIDIGSSYTNEGDVYLVYYLSDEDIIDSEGANYGKLEIVVGKGKVTHTQENMSTLVSDTFENNKKTITRTSNSPISSIFGSSQVEEESGSPTQIPFRFGQNQQNKHYLVKRIIIEN